MFARIVHPVSGLTSILGHKAATPRGNPASTPGFLSLVNPAWRIEMDQHRARMPIDFNPVPVRLEGRNVVLEPLAPEHAEPLFDASQSAAIWRWLSIPMFDSIQDVIRWIEEARRAQGTGTEVAFAVVRRSDGRVVGSTRYLDIRRSHRTLEIGWTWLAPEAQRTAINTEAKLLLLTHAFESHGAVRVQLKTDERNEQSRTAICRLGAAFEGILRNYQTRALDGYVRNTAMYSVTREEWPAVKFRLASRLSV